MAYDQILVQKGKPEPAVADRVAMGKTVCERTPDGIAFHGKKVCMTGTQE